MGCMILLILLCNIILMVNNIKSGKLGNYRFVKSVDSEI